MRWCRPAPPCGAPWRGHAKTRYERNDRSRGVGSTGPCVLSLRLTAAAISPASTALLRLLKTDSEEPAAGFVRKQQPGERVACVRALLLSARSGEIADDDEMLVLAGMQEPGVPGAALLSLLTSGTAGRPCRCCGAEHQFDERPRPVLLLVLFESQLYVVADLCFGAGASRDLANSCLDETVARAAERASRVGGLDG